PGGGLGFLDALIAIPLFATFAHLVFTWGKPLWVIALVSAAFLALGVVLFGVRQRKERDDGFLAVVAFSVWALIKGERSQRNEPAPGAPPLDELEKSRFFAPAVRHYGIEVVRGPHAVAKIMGIFIMVTFFWALFDQSASSWVRQAELM